MPEDAPVEKFQSFLSRLREALTRSPADYTAVAVDKHLLQDLIQTGEETAEAYWARVTEATNALERAGVLEDTLDEHSSIDPDIIS